jgi:tartrate dehydrogenase/decarboxylase/D-malate dehydrogenase
MAPGKNPGMDIRQLKYFLAIVDHGGFNRAATALYVSQPALSQTVQSLPGSIGIAPSASLNPERTYPSMFEPVHGSAPDIAGRGIANPLGAIGSAALMLDHLGHTEAAQNVNDAIAAVLAKSDVRTRDLGGTATTDEFTEKLLELL